MADISDELQQDTNAEEAKAESGASGSPSKAEKRQRAPKSERAEGRAEGRAAAAATGTARPRGYSPVVKRFLKLAKDAKGAERDYFLSCANTLAMLELARTIQVTFSKAGEAAEGGPLSPEEALASGLFDEDE
jgi:flagellar biosynthesis/type III secretory pathway protein FliH